MAGDKYGTPYTTLGITYGELNYRKKHAIQLSHDFTVMVIKTSSLKHVHALLKSSAIWPHYCYTPYKLQLWSNKTSDKTGLQLFLCTCFDYQSLCIHFDH